MFRAVGRTPEISLALSVVLVLVSFSHFGRTSEQLLIIDRIFHPSFSVTGGEDRISYGIDG